VSTLDHLDWQYHGAGQFNYLNSEELQRPALLLLRRRRCFDMLTRIAAFVGRGGRKESTRRRSIAHRRRLLKHIVTRLLEDVVSLGNEQRVSSETADVSVGLERAEILRDACKHEMSGNSSR
jgi:hypothetical protein